MKNKSEKTVGYTVAIGISVVLGVAGYFIFKYVFLGANAYKVYASGLSLHSIIPDFIYSILGAIVFLSIALIFAFFKSDCKPIKRILIVIICLAGFVTFETWANTDCIAFNDTGMVAVNSFNEKYEDITVYKIKYATDGVEVIDYRDQTICVIDYGKGFYEVPIMTNGTYEQKQFDAQIKKHNVKVVTVEELNDIPNYK